MRVKLIRAEISKGRGDPLIALLRSATGSSIESIIVIEYGSRRDLTILTCSLRIFKVNYLFLIIGPLNYLQ